MPYSAFGNHVYHYGDPKLEAKTDLRSKYRKEQKFAHIFNEAISNNTHWKDPEFPHEDSSVGSYVTLFDNADKTKQTQINEWKGDGWSGSATWIRVAELCNTIYQGANTPCFNCDDIGKTIARNDIQQGETGDCWFLSSVADVAMVKSLIENVVPDNNRTNDQGVYHFRFWYQGTWVDVVVDDYLPCIVTNKHTFTIGSNFYPNNGKAEYWPMLLEKAFAKLNSGYSCISSNIIMNAQESLTGGFGDYIALPNDVPKDTYKQILKWFDRGCVVGAGTTQSANGIVGPHAYSVTGARVITTDDGNEHNLLRCRNPWGNTEWTGDWSDTSPLWGQVSQHQKDDIGFVVKDEGEFWISFTDLVANFSDIDGCFYYDSAAVKKSDSTHKFAQFLTNWSVSVNTAGGFQNPWENPLFEVELASENSTALLAVGILVQTKLANCNMAHGNCIRLFPAGAYTIYDKKFFNNQSNAEIYPAGQTEVPGNNSNSYSQFYELTPGKYIVVASSIHAGIEETIVVRVYNEGKEPASKVVSESSSSASSGSESE